jgi:hypothetical protein
MNDYFSRLTIRSFNAFNISIVIRSLRLNIYKINSVEWEAIYRVYKKNWTDLKLLSISQNTYLYPIFYIYIASLGSYNVE